MFLSEGNPWPKGRQLSGCQAVIHLMSLSWSGRHEVVDGRKAAVKRSSVAVQKVTNCAASMWLISRQLYGSLRSVGLEDLMALMEALARR